MPTKNLDDEETLSRLTGDVIHGVLLSLPEYIEMPDRLVYQLTDEVMAFNSHCGNGILHGWTTAQELWRNEILPRTTILMQQTSVIPEFRGLWMKKRLYLLEWKLREQEPG